MKKFLFIALALFTTAAFAGDHAHHGHDGKHPGKKGGGHHVERMAEKLDLTDDQQAQMKTLFKEQGEKMRELHKETQQRMDGVLTDEQRQKAEAMREKRAEKWEERKEKWKEKKDR